MARQVIEAGGREILDDVAKDRERQEAGQATGTEAAVGDGENTSSSQALEA